MVNVSSAFRAATTETAPRLANWTLARETADPGATLGRKPGRCFGSPASSLTLGCHSRPGCAGSSKLRAITLAGRARSLARLWNHGSLPGSAVFRSGLRGAEPVPRAPFRGRAPEGPSGGLHACSFHAVKSEKGLRSSLELTERLTRPFSHARNEYGPAELPTRPGHEPCCNGNHGHATLGGQMLDAFGVERGGFRCGAARAAWVAA